MTRARRFPPASDTGRMRQMTPKTLFALVALVVLLLVLASVAAGAVIGPAFQ